MEASRNPEPDKRFSWTLAGWLLTHVLGPQQDPDRRARIEQAVRDGAIAFHALPFTLHTETEDLEDLVHGLGFSSRLARRYGLPLPIAGRSSEVTVRLPAELNARTLRPVDLRGEPAGPPVALEGHSFRTQLRAYAPASFLLESSGPAPK